MSSCGTVRLIPGPQGAAGADGTDGVDGISAFTLVAVGFTMPAEQLTVAVDVADSTWMTSGMIVYVQNCGWMLVTGIADSTHITLQNLEDTATSAYVDNVAPGTAVAVSNKIVAAGLQGPAGTNGTSGAPDTAHYVTTQNEGGLSAEFNLGALTTGMLKHTVAAGVSTPATASDGIDYLSPTTGVEVTDIGVSVQAYDAFLTSIALLGTAADKMIYTTGVDTAAETTITGVGRTVVGQATLAALKTYLGIGYSNTVTKLVGYTATLADDVILCDATAGAITIDLPSAATATDKTFTIKKIDASANTVTIDGNLGETIDGAATQVIAAQWTAIEIVCDGSNWYII